MSCRVRSCFLLACFLSTGAAVLLCAGDGLAQNKAQKKAAKKAKQVVVQEAKLGEAATLKQALLLLAMANENYEGHRVKAMHQVQEALNILDKSVRKKGTPAQRAASLQAEVVEARAKFIAKLGAVRQEPQYLSNLQVQEAGRLLLGVRAVLAQNNQKVVMGHVNGALHQIELALKSR